MVDETVHFLLFHLAQQAVEVHVEELQIEVGGDERREVVIVVALVDVEQLLVLVGHDGEAVGTECVHQPLVGFFELPGVDEIVDVDHFSR